MSEHKAGEGLPFLENAVIKFILIPVVKVTLNWQNSLKLLQKEEEKIKSLIEDIPEHKRAQVVAINRVFGIEHHSCNYSINMVLEHLNIVTQAMIFVIDSLSKEIAIEQEIKIETVKPKANSQEEAEHYFQTLRQYKLFIKKHNKKVSKTTKEHPWFIAFNNEEWACFNYIHTFVHRRQIQAIIKALN